MAFAYYLEPTGGRMISLEERWSRSDTVDVAYLRRSNDYGSTWSEPTQRVTGERTPQGMLRRHPRGFWVDPQEAKALELWNEGVLPNDDPLEGLRQWNIYYRMVGSDTTHPVVHRGAEYNESHPLPGVWRGKNALMLGDQGSQPLKRKDGSILLPAQISPLTPEGTLYNPGAGYTWTEAVVLIGRWAGDRIEWEISDAVRGDPTRTTRGMVEPTLAELTGGRLLMVMRGSNDKNPEYLVTSGRRGRKTAENRGRLRNPGPTPGIRRSSPPARAPCS